MTSVLSILAAVGSITVLIGEFISLSGTDLVNCGEVLCIGTSLNPRARKSAAEQNLNLKEAMSWYGSDHSLSTRATLVLSSWCLSPKLYIQ
jgi:hypothetical protein